MPIPFAYRPLCEWVLGLTLISMGLLGCGWILWEVWNEGDRMVGMLFSFLPLIAFPIWGLTFLGVVAAAMRRMWIFCVLGLLSVVVPWLVFFPLSAPALITEASWQYGVSLNDRLELFDSGAREVATLVHGPGLYDLNNLSPIPEFRWHVEHEIAAPEGTFYGFRRHGILHVRVQKVRHGWRGLALMPEGRDRPFDSEEHLCYEEELQPGWWAWSTGQPN